MKAGACLMLPVLIAAAQDDAGRQIWNTEFLNKRPAGGAASGQRPVSYKPKTGTAAAATLAKPQSAMLGITLWRLRPPGAADPSGARLLVLESTGPDKAEQVVERIGTDTTLSEGDRVRISVEGSASGYLYVIDREQYADGAMSDPYLIYPNRLTRVGDNRLAAGRLIDIPDQRDRPNVLTVRSSRGSQAREVLSFLVTQQPLEDLRIGDTPLRLEPALYQEWEKKWGAEPDQLELEGTHGQAWTPREKQASADHRNLLTQRDPPPQTLYRVAVPPQTPFLVRVPLRLRN